VNVVQEDENVSVICPVRNEARRIEEMYLSLRSQTHQNWILYFGDNASDDGTLEIVSRLASTDKRCVVNSFVEPMPIHDNFMRTIDWALESVTGNYIQFLAGDDILGDELYLSTAISALKQKEAVIACGKVQGFTDDSPVQSHDFGVLASLTEGHDRKHYAIRNYWTCNLIYGFYDAQHFVKTLRSPLGSFTPNLSSDWWFSYIASETAKITYSSDLVYRKYRKPIEYNSAHYSLQQGRKRTPPPWMHVFTFPWKQLGDRSKVLGLLPSLKLASLFQARELRAAYARLVSKKLST